MKVLDLGPESKNLHLICHFSLIIWLLGCLVVCTCWVVWLVGGWFGWFVAWPPVPRGLEESQEQAKEGSRQGRARSAKGGGSKQRKLSHLKTPQQSFQKTWEG